MEAMDGPVNFGDRDKWWGLMVEGYDREPMYGMSFNPSYYETLFANYGFENFYNQYYYHKPLSADLPDRFKERYEKFKLKEEYSVQHLDKNVWTNMPMTLCIFTIQHGRNMEKQKPLRRIKLWNF